MLITADAIFLILILFTIYNIESKAEKICTTPPPGCFLNCPNGYENFGTENCLCLCKQPSLSTTATCFGFVCKSDERCVNVNGRVGCIQVTPVHPLLPSAPSSAQIARPVVPSVINSGVHLGPRDQYQSVPSIKEKEKATDSSSLIGECPQIVSGNCDVQCRTDSDCPMDAGMRCCPNGCGRECVLAVNVVPFQSHLAIRPLKIGNTKEKEENIGEEQPKTSLEQCQIKCKNPLYQCQLVESDCPNPPCPAVPKCLINPCPTGAPMKMANGVTALCKRQTQCWDGFWCHQIGYHGLGFCCPAPKKVVKVGICPAQQQRGKNEELGNGRENEQKCLAECKSDGDCGLVEKCCFNGCGLSCRRTKLGEGRGNEREEEEEGGNEREFGQTMTPKHGIGTEEQGGDLALIKRPQSANWKGGSQEGIIVGKKSTIKCPILSEKQRNQLDCSAATGTDECKMDSDCSGHLKCCSDGCQMRCIYIPPSQTAEGSHQNGISEESSGSQSPAEERRPAEENLIKMTGGHNGQEEEEFGQNRENGNKIGICPKWGQENRQQFCDGRKKWAEEEEDECQNDLDCGGLQKCCLDGCGSRRICQFPSISSECLSQRMAAEILSKFSKHNRNRGFKPKCDSEGHFLPIQRSSDGFNWCVDSRGMELPGTRLPNSHFNGCEQRKICPFIECPLKCPFGHQMDGIGCPQCICKDSPCRGIQCPESNVCRMAERKCLNLDGNGQNDGQSKSNIVNCLIPECVLNICLQGDPLEDTETGAMLRCDEERGRKCPPGYYCHKLGIGDAGYCCAGLVLQSELWPSASKCPSMPNLAYKRKKKKKTENEDGQIRFGSIKQAIGCRFSRECGEGNGKICCFNGWATECTKIGGRNEEGKVETMDNDEERADEKRENQRIKTATMTTNMPDDDSPRISAGDFGTTETFERNDGIAKIASGPCPSYLRNVSNPGCTNNCQNDADCAKRNGQMRCCQVGCGQQCHFPERLSPCVHLLATTFREVDKLAKMPETLGRPTVQCTPEGLFHPIQFDAISGQYWCVDQLNGIEQPGTRISSSPVGSALPDCSIRHQCKIECPKEKMERCEHGLRLDHRGCPTDERCECRNSCDDFKCSLPDSEICILKSVKCVMAPIEGKTNNVACPSVPICVPNVCRQQTPKMELANKKACLSDSECIGNGNTAECRPINDPIERIGLCCQHEERQLEQPLIDPTSSLNEPAIINGGIQPHHHSHSHTVETRQGICPARIISGNEGMANECLDECKKDSQCAGIQKCCPMEGGGCSRCVQPLLATNCQNLLSTLQSMDSARIHHFLPPPICDRRGTFERIQCDGQAFCWCVDSQMGRPILGTRKLQPIGDFCSDRKTCPIFCPQRRLLECPFGVEMDLDGCPLTSECRCRTLCEQVRCPEGEICLLSARDCQEREQNEEAICLPMPTCQRSPCGGLLQPALGPNSKLPLHCFLTNGAETQLADQLCPNGFRCVRPIHHLYGQKQQPQDGAQGICCPLDEEEEATMEMRENGQNNQVDFIILGTNPCFLAMNQGRAEGCDRKMELRFFHDFSQQSCEEFVFSGCGGNSNNFRSRAECEQQCLGGTQKQQDEKEMFSMGFTLIPPQGHKIEGGRMDEDRSEFDRRELESSLRSYLRENFNLDNTQIRDVHFGPIDGTNNNSNHIQFSILAKDARRKAKSISDAFASGQFQFPHQNQLFRAQPDTWFARQIPLTSSIEGSENSDKNAKSALFWVILTASIFFSLVVLMVLCCGYAFLYERSHSQSSGGSVCFSPSPQIGAIHHHWSPLPNRKNADPLSTEEIHRMRANAAGGGGGQLLTPMPSSTSTASASTHLPVQQTTIIAPKIISEDEARMGERRRGGGINQTAKTTLYY